MAIKNSQSHTVAPPLVYHVLVSVPGRPPKMSPLDTLVQVCSIVMALKNYSNIWLLADGEWLDYLRNNGVLKLYSGYSLVSEIDPGAFRSKVNLTAFWSTYAKRCALLHGAKRYKLTVESGITPGGVILLDTDAVLFDELPWSPLLSEKDEDRVSTVFYGAYYEPSKWEAYTETIYRLGYLIGEYMEAKKYPYQRPIQKELKKTLPLNAGFMYFRRMEHLHGYVEGLEFIMQRFTEDGHSPRPFRAEQFVEGSEDVFFSETMIADQLWLSFYLESVAKIRIDPCFKVLESFDRAFEVPSCRSLLHVWKYKNYLNESAERQFFIHGLISTVQERAVSVLRDVGIGIHEVNLLFPLKDLRVIKTGLMIHV